jgi:hypothetical protein
LVIREDEVIVHGKGHVWHGSPARGGKSTQGEERLVWKGRAGASYGVGMKWLYKCEHLPPFVQRMTKEVVLK